jgi:hypothetical protein
LLTVLTVVPAPERPSTGIEHNLEHFLAFALLGILFALSYPGRFDLLQDFRTRDYLRDCPPSRRSRCANQGSRTSR